MIRTENISKTFSDVHAVSDLSLNVRDGEIYGFLGLNGAGKTTTIRMLLGMIKPSSGSAFILGRKITTNDIALLKRIGSLVEIPYAYPDLTIRENLELFRRLRFLPKSGTVETIVAKLHLEPYVNRKAKNLSHGNKQRLGLAKALMHNPDILILDEPTNGLDPAGIFEIREMLVDLAQNHGVTIFISSHILGEVSRFATRIGIIHHGRLVKEFDSGELKALCKKRVLIDTANNDRANEILVQSGYNPVKRRELQLEVYDEKAISNPASIAQMLVNENCPPVLLKVEEEDLESYFLRTIGVHNE